MPVRSGWGTSFTLFRTRLHSPPSFLGLPHNTLLHSHIYIFGQVTVPSFTSHHLPLHSRHDRLLDTSTGTMTRRNSPEPSLPFTEQTLSTMDIILPCPANSHHTAVVQVFGLASSKHRHQPFFDASSTSTSSSSSQKLLRNDSRNELRRRDASREEIAWGFVPVAFRPSPDKLDSGRSLRPTAADLVGVSSTSIQVLIVI